MKVEKIVSIETREYRFTVGGPSNHRGKSEEIADIVFNNDNFFEIGYSIFGISGILLAFIPYHAVQVIFYDMVEK